jgi:hypothetical protein
MAPKLKTPKATATAAETMASVENFMRLCLLHGRLQKELPPAAAGEIERRDVVYQKSIVPAAGAPKERLPAMTQEFKRSDAEFFHALLK